MVFSKKKLDFKFVLLLFIFSLAFINSFGQTDSIFSKFFNDIFTKPPKSDVIYYSQCIDNYYINKFKNALRIHVIKPFWAYNPKKSAENKDSIILSDDEKKYIIDEIIDGSKTPWHVKFEFNAILLSCKSDSSGSNIKIEDSEKNFKLAKNSTFHTYSKPVFLRNHKYCVFYQDIYKGPLNAGGDLSVYINNNGIWKLYIKIYEWIS